MSWSGPNKVALYRSRGKTLLMARIARKMTARTIKNMHVPAYCPVDAGVHAVEYKGVLVPEKKTIIMSSIPIIMVPPLLMELAVLMALPAIVEVGEPAMLVIDDIPDISIVIFCATVDCLWYTARRRQGTFELYEEMIKFEKEMLVSLIQRPALRGRPFIPLLDPISDSIIPVSK